MTALAEALLAAQRQAVAALSRAYVAGHLDAESLASQLAAVGATDVLDQAALLASLDVLREYGQAPAAAERREPETQPASDAQLRLIAKLADERGTLAPDGPLTKAQAHEVIDAIKNGSYDPDKWRAPF